MTAEATPLLSIFLVIALATLACIEHARAQASTAVQIVERPTLTISGVAGFTGAVLRHVTATGIVTDSVWSARS